MKAKTKPRTRRTGATFDSVTPEAWEWLTDPHSIEGAQAPYTYLDPKLLIGLSQEIFGRPLEIEEVKCLVVLDSEKYETCFSTGAILRTVKYLTEIPGNLESQLNARLFLDEIVLPYYGCYFVIEKKGQLVIATVSGGLWTFDKTSARYVADTNSILHDAIEYEGPGLPRAIALQKLEILKRQKIIEIRRRKWAARRAGVRAFLERVGAWFKSRPREERPEPKIPPLIHQNKPGSISKF